MSKTERRSLVTTVNQNIEEKLKPLEDQCEKGLAIIYANEELRERRGGSSREVEGFHRNHGVKR